MSCPERIRIGNSVWSSENGTKQRCSFALGRLSEKAVIHLLAVLVSGVLEIATVSLFTLSHTAHAPVFLSCMIRVLVHSTSTPL
jgi:hypothetical protein